MPDSVSFIILVFLLTIVASFAIFQVDCNAMNITVVNDCELHIRNTLQSYVSDGKYSASTIPIGGDGGPLETFVWMTFQSISGVSIIEGTISLSVFVDIVWFDAFLTWDPELTLGIESIYIRPELVYNPDFILYNAVGNYADMLSSQVIEWYADGGLWNSRQGQITFACNFLLTQFPADSQTCTAEFASFLYPSDGLLFLEPPDYLEYDIPTNLTQVVVMPSFTSSEWKVKGVTGETNLRPLYGTYYSFATFSVELKRYPQYYLATAVYPDTMVTIITILAFWVTDISSRLGLSVTALLTILAVQWSVSASLPVSKEFTWLSKYSLVCIVLVALCVAEACIVAYMRNNKSSSPVPQWVRLLTALSTNGRKAFRLVTCYYGLNATLPCVFKSNTHERLVNAADTDEETGGGANHVVPANKNGVQLISTALAPLRSSAAVHPTVESSQASQHQNHTADRVPAGDGFEMYKNSSVETIPHDVQTTAVDNKSADESCIDERRAVDEAVDDIDGLEEGFDNIDEGGDNVTQPLNNAIRSNPAAGVKPSKSQARRAALAQEKTDELINIIAWTHGADALDDCASVFFPVVYIIVIGVMIAVNPTIPGLNLLEPSTFQLGGILSTIPAFQEYSKHFLEHNKSAVHTVCQWKILFGSDLYYIMSAFHMVGKEIGREIARKSNVKNRDDQQTHQTTTSAHHERIAESISRYFRQGVAIRGLDIFSLPDFGFEHHASEKAGDPSDSTSTAKEDSVSRNHKPGHHHLEHHHHHRATQNGTFDRDTHDAPSGSSTAVSRVASPVSRATTPVPVDSTDGTTSPIAAFNTLNELSSEDNSNRSVSSVVSSDNDQGPQHAHRQHQANKELVKFGLSPGDDEVIDSFFCALYPKQGLFILGRMFITQDYLAFSGWPNTRVLLQLMNVQEVDKERNVDFVPMPICVTMLGGEQYVFGSFVDRAHCYTLLNDLSEINRRLLKEEDRTAIEAKITAAQKLVFGYQSRNCLFPKVAAPTLPPAPIHTRESVVAAATTTPRHSSKAIISRCSSPSLLSSPTSPVPAMGSDASYKSSKSPSERSLPPEPTKAVSVPNFSHTSNKSTEMAPSYASTGHASHSKDTPDAINLSTLFAAHKITPLTEEDCIFDFPVVDLWKAYFLDGCGYGDFLLQQQDLFIESGEWEPFSLNPVPEDVANLPFTYSRHFAYSHPRTSMLFYGPKNAPAYQTQYLYMPSEIITGGETLQSVRPRRGVVLNVTQLDGIPLSDVFKTLQYWSFEAHPENGCKTIVRVGLAVHYMKNTAFKTQIFGGIKDEFSQQLKAWIAFVQDRVAKYQDAHATAVTALSAAVIDTQVVPEGVTRSRASSRAAAPPTSEAPAAVRSSRPPSTTQLPPPSQQQQRSRASTPAMEPLDFCSDNEESRPNGGLIATRILHRPQPRAPSATAGEDTSQDGSLQALGHYLQGVSQDGSLQALGHYFQAIGCTTAETKEQT